MTIAIDIGTDTTGKTAPLDLEELLATRLLVQGNSGSGKSHLLRRLLEQSAPWVQQVIVDPEGDFVSLADKFGHVVVDAADHGEADLVRIAARIREHRVSVILNLESLEVEMQMKAAATFLNGMFDAPRELWYPVLVVVDEAQLFAPAAAGEVSDDARRTSLAAMTNLMCRGRKRGLAGVIATQRLAKLAKNVAAEASNFLMGRTFLDIDMARAADLLGMERRQAEMFRDLQRGEFVALGPALSRRPLPVRIGVVETGSRSTSPKLMPLPVNPGEEEQHALLFAIPEREERPVPPPRPQPIATDDLLKTIGKPSFDAPSLRPQMPDMPGEERDAVIAAVLQDMLADADCAYRAAPVLFQDFLVRCRMRRLADPGLDLAGFKGRLSMARAGVFDGGSEGDGWTAASEVAQRLPEDMQGVFLLLARAGKDGLPCPNDEEVALVYGSRSPARARRLLSYMESQDIIVTRMDMRGNRSISIPELGWTTAPGDPGTAPGMVRRAL